MEQALCASLTRKRRLYPNVSQLSLLSCLHVRAWINYISEQTVCLMNDEKLQGNIRKKVQSLLQTIFPIGKNLKKGSPQCLPCRRCWGSYTRSSTSFPSAGATGDQDKLSQGSPWLFFSARVKLTLGSKQQWLLGSHIPPHSKPRSVIKQQGVGMQACGFAIYTNVHLGRQNSPLLMVSADPTVQTEIWPLS